MDFFRSILADDPDPETPNPYEESDSDPPLNQSPNHQNETEEDEEEEEDDSTSYLNSSEDGSAIGIGGGGLWSFGDLVKTLTTKSESVFETYRRDLKEFGTGLRKESDLFREVASRAVKELPSSIEVVGTSAIDGVLKSTAEFISQGKESLLSSPGIDYSDGSERRRSTTDRSGLNSNPNLNSNSRRYSRFDSQLNAIRTDTRTYCEDPEDIDDYKKWKLGFVMGDNRDEIEKLVGDNGVLAGIYSKLVPTEVDDGTFWYRYFYKINKFKMQEDLRAKLVKRSLSQDIEEELSWDIDDDDDDNNEERQKKQEKSDHLRSNTSKTRDLENVEKQVKNPNDESQTQSSKILIDDKEMNTKNVSSVNKNDLEEAKPDGGKKVESEKVDLKPDENEDLEWDEFEEVENNDEKKNVTKGDIKNKDDLVKRLSTAVDDDEDLSWDIEDDDDEVVKSGNK